MSRRPLAMFLVLAYAISWLMWAPLVLARWGVIGPPSPYLHPLGSLGPAIAAVVTVATFGRGPGLTRLIRRLYPPRVSLGWYLVAVGGPVVLVLVALAVAGFFGDTPGDPSRIGRTAEFSRLSWLGYWALAIGFYGFGEEIGWRGYALPYLERSGTALKAAFSVSLLWAT